jgi:hypothetical protein
VGQSAVDKWPRILTVYGYIPDSIQKLNSTVLRWTVYPGFQHFTFVLLIVQGIQQYSFTILILLHCAHEFNSILLDSLGYPRVQQYMHFHLHKFSHVVRCQHLYFVSLPRCSIVYFCLPQATQEINRYSYMFSLSGSSTIFFYVLHSSRSIVYFYILVSHRHRGGRIQKINAWYLNTHMVYL